MTKRKEDAILEMGPYDRSEQSVWISHDEEIFDGDFGTHLYVRTDRTQDGKVVFFWQGPKEVPSE